MNLSEWLDAGILFVVTTWMVLDRLNIYLREKPTKESL